MNPVRNIKYVHREKYIEKVSRVRNVVYSYRKGISNGVKVSIRNLQKRIPVNPKRIKEAVLKILSQERINKSGEITLCFVNDQKIKELNLKYLGKNNPTDVLAFNITNVYPRGVHKVTQNIFADIVISTDRAIENAHAFHTQPLFELYLYVIHGVLHILGYDDQTRVDRLLMRKKERQILKTLDLSS